MNNNKEIAQRSYVAGETVGCLNCSQGSVCSVEHAEQEYRRWCCALCTEKNSVQMGHFVCSLPPKDWIRIELENEGDKMVIKKASADGIPPALVARVTSIISEQVRKLSLAQALSQGWVSLDSNNQLVDYPGRWPALSGADEEFKEWPPDTPIVLEVE
jgi:hypothetical protein